MKKNAAIQSNHIQIAVKRLAGMINKRYRGQQVVFVGILNGCFMFFSDLMKHVNVDNEVDFICYRSYQDNCVGEGVLRKGLDLNVKDKVVICIDEMVDSGGTKRVLTKLIQEKGAKEVKWCFLLQRGFQDNDEDLIGMKVNPAFFYYGYGLDDKEKNRHLTDIYTC